MTIFLHTTPIKIFVEFFSKFQMMLHLLVADYINYRLHIASWVNLINILSYQQAAVMGEQHQFAAETCLILQLKGLHRPSMLMTQMLFP